MHKQYTSYTQHCNRGERERDGVGGGGGGVAMDVNTEVNATKGKQNKEKFSCSL